MADSANDSDDRDVTSRYEKVEAKLLGEGTYGEVYKVRDNQTGDVLAMKKMKLHDEEEGIPSTAIREVSILKELPHPNVVHLRDVYCTKQKVFLVFEYVESDLKKYMKKCGGALKVSVVKDFSAQLLSGLDFCHNHRIIHRDLKPQNLLITHEEGRPPILKIADFGLARAFTLPIPKYTHEVVTVWYRAPEILLGQAEYSLPVDIWSSGCIIGEMGCGNALFMGDCEIDTIFKIFQKLGTPTPVEWPGLHSLKDFKADTFPRWRKKSWHDIRDLGKLVGIECCDLLENLMKFDPARRISAKRAMQHPFFTRTDREFTLSDGSTLPNTINYTINGTNLGVGCDKNMVVNSGEELTFGLPQLVGNHMNPSQVQGA